MLLRFYDGALTDRRPFGIIPGVHEPVGISRSRRRTMPGAGVFAKGSRVRRRAADRVRATAARA